MKILVSNAPSPKPDERNLRTVDELIEELRKFPGDAKCHAYDGEVTGISVSKGDRFGFIHCHGDDKCPQGPTHLIEE